MRHNRTNYSSYSKLDSTEPVEESKPLEDVAPSWPEEKPTIEEPTPNKVRIGKVVNCSMVNVRTSPKSDSPIAAIIPAEETVVVLEGPKDGYYKVLVNNVIDGYIKEEYLYTWTE